MKKTAKAAIAIVLSVIMLAALSVLPAFGEEAPGKTNYVTEKWVAYFAGTLTETEEDGVLVTEYIPENAYSWFSPTWNIYNDLKTLIGDRNGAVVNISFEIQGATDKKDVTYNTRVLVRAENPRTGNLVYDPSVVGDWDGEGTAWTELYKENFDSDLEFNIEAQNNYAFPADGQLEINGTDWTYYETGPIYIAKADLNDDLFGGWLLCFDGLDYNANFLKGLRLRNASIIDCEEGTATKAPETPTEAPTDAPAKTDEPAKTEAPVQQNTPEATSGDASAATPGKQDNKEDGNRSNAGLIIGIIAGVIVVAAVVAGVIIGKKKKSK